MTFFDHESESMVLSALMQSSPTIERLMPVLRDDDFDREIHRRIYSDIIRLHKSGMVADLVSVAAEFKRRGEEGEIADIAEISGLPNCVGNVDYYVGVIRDTGLKRRTLAIVAETRDALNDPLNKGVDISGEMERKISAANLSSCGTEYRHVSARLPEVCDELDRAIKTNGAIDGIEAPFRGMDDLTGFRNSEYILIGARPSIGKTALALNIVEEIAIRRKIGVGFFSIEMSAKMLNMRMISSYGGMNSGLLTKGMYKTKADLEKIEHILYDIAESPLFIDDTSALKISELKTKARRMARVDKCKIIFIDYIGLMDAEESRLPRHEQIAICSRSIKNLAKELKIPIVVLSQVLRDTEGKRPGLQSLAETRSLEQDADVVMFLHRERADLIESGGRPDEIPSELIVAKNRNGPTGICPLIFKPRLTKFVDDDTMVNKGD